MTTVNPLPIFISTLNQKPIRTVAVSNGEGSPQPWYLFKDILIALGYSASTAENGTNYQSQSIRSDEDKAKLPVHLEESRKKVSTPMFISKHGAESFINDWSLKRGKEQRAHMEIESGEPVFPEDPEEAPTDISYDEKLIEQLLDNPDVFIALLERYRQERSVRIQKEEALNNIMKVIETAGRIS